MRIIPTVVFFAFSFMPLSAQEAVKTPDNTAQKFIAVLAAHPDGNAVKTLKTDIESGQVSVAVDKTLALFSINEWENVAMRLVSGIVAQKTLVLPNDFFAYDSCPQKLMVQTLGLGYAQVLKLDKPVLEVLRKFAMPGFDDPDENERKNLMELLGNFEKAALENADSFASFTFLACSQDEVRMIFGTGGSVSDAESFAKAAKENIAKEFETLKSQIP